MTEALDTSWKKLKSSLVKTSDSSFALRTVAEEREPPTAATQLFTTPAQLLTKTSQPTLTTDGVDCAGLASARLILSATEDPSKTMSSWFIVWGYASGLGWRWLQEFKLVDNMHRFLDPVDTRGVSRLFVQGIESNTGFAVHVAL
jgi:hypothetical protein